MPITSPLTLSQLANREDLGPGVKTWMIHAVDDRGRRWRHGTLKMTLAEAEVIRDAVVFNLAEQDNQELLEWVQARNTVADFDFTNRDITEDQGEEYIFQWFAEAEGAEAITVAWWMNDINTGKFNAVRDRIGYTGDQGADITSRFTFMVSVNPWYDLTVEAP